MVVDRLITCKAVKQDSHIYATHFSHKHNPPHEQLRSKLVTLGINCAVDGLTFDIGDKSQTNQS